MSEFKARALVVQAVQFTGGKASGKEVIKFLKEHDVEAIRRKKAESWEVPNREGRGQRGWNEAIITDATGFSGYEIPKDYWVVWGHQGKDELSIMDSDFFFSIYQPK
jgi:hypothetical protein